MNRTHLAPDLDDRVARAVALPAVLTMQVEIRDEAKIAAPKRTGRLAYEIDADAAVLHGATVTGTVHSSAIDERGVDYAAFQEFGTRFISPRAYMRRSAERVARRWGGNWRPSPPPWPSR